MDRCDTRMFFFVFLSLVSLHVSDSREIPGVHITKNPNFDPISTFSYFHYKSKDDPNFCNGNLNLCNGNKRKLR